MTAKIVLCFSYCGRSGKPNDLGLSEKRDLFSYRGMLSVGSRSVGIRRGRKLLSADWHLCRRGRRCRSRARIPRVRCVAHRRRRRCCGVRRRCTPGRTGSSARPILHGVTASGSAAGASLEAVASGVRSYAHAYAASGARTAGATVVRTGVRRPRSVRTLKKDRKRDTVIIMSLGFIELSRQPSMSKNF